MILSLLVLLMTHVIHCHQVWRTKKGGGACDISSIGKYSPTSLQLSSNQVQVNWRNIHGQVLQDGLCVQYYLVSYTKVTNTAPHIRRKRAPHIRRKRTLHIRRKRAPHIRRMRAQAPHIRRKRASLRNVEVVTAPLESDTTNHTFRINHECAVLEFKIIVVPRQNLEMMIYSAPSVLWLSSPPPKLDLLSKVAILSSHKCGNTLPPMLLTACQVQYLQKIQAQCQNTVSSDCQYENLPKTVTNNIENHKNIQNDITNQGENLEENQVKTVTNQSDKCISTSLKAGTDTYLLDLEPCKPYRFTVWLKQPDEKLQKSHNPVWTALQYTNLELYADIVTGETDAQVTVFPHQNCSSGENIWLLTYCPHHIEHQEHSQCRSIKIIPNQFQSTIIINDLEPCTQYTFRLVEDQVRGKQEKLVTESTKCPGKESVSGSKGVWYLKENRNMNEDLPRELMIKSELELESFEDSILVYFVCAGGGLLLGLTLGFILAGLVIWVRKDKLSGKGYKVKEKIREKDYQLLKGKDQVGEKDYQLLKGKDQVGEKDYQLLKGKDQMGEKDYQLLKGKDPMGEKENNVINSKNGKTTAKILLDNYGENNGKF